MKVIVALDSGTTNGKTILIGCQANALARTLRHGTAPLPRSWRTEKFSE
jgi:sugar (pentulose or hexulose) kinase